MRSHLKIYTFKLKTLSPLFIGSGKEITKKEYVYVPNGHRVIMLNFDKFTRFLIEKNLIDDYTEFMIGPEKDLYKWLIRKRVNLEDIEKLKAYELNGGDAIIPGKTLKGVQLFIKDNYGEPYVPGSSLKGALRTAMLARMVDENASSGARHFMKLENEMKHLSGFFRKNTFLKEAQEIESEFFHTLNFRPDRKRDAVNSVFKGIQISDSLPIDRKNLILCTKVDVTRDGKEHPVEVVCRECIKPGTEISFSITLDTGISKESGIDMSFILSSVRKFSELQYKYFSSKFFLPKNKDTSQAADGLELILGGGTGFVSKTIIYPLGREKALSFTSRLLDKQFVKHKHMKDISDGVSPHMIKCTKYDGKTYVLGRCECQVIE